MSEGVEQTAHAFENRTRDYWLKWVHRLAIPFEWQDAVIRAAITLKLCTYEPTGAIVAALTTSIPEAPNTQRNWDYRYCWVRDAYFVVRALNRLAAVRKMENYFAWLMNVVASATESHIQPVYGIGQESALKEKIVASLPGYRGMGPVRIGNQAYEHLQHDGYGNVILGVAQAFLDRRLLSPPARTDFLRLEEMGRWALAVFDKPDAGMWELRSRASACIRPRRSCVGRRSIAFLLYRRLYRRAGTGAGLAGKGRSSEAKHSCTRMVAAAQRFRRVIDGDHLDAGVLLMVEVGFIDPQDSRMVSTVDQIERVLARGPSCSAL